MDADADLDDICGLDKFLLEPPSIDWTFGGMFKDNADVHSTGASSLAGIVESSDGQENDGD